MPYRGARHAQPAYESKAFQNFDVGMAMIMGAFISFMLLGRNTSDYLIVDTLMLGACGISICFGGASSEKCWNI